LEKRTLKISLLMYLILLLCAVVDFTLSYHYYLHNTGTFVATETNSEFVAFLTTGHFPFNNFLKFILAFPLLLFLLSWFDIFRETLNDTLLAYLERFGRTFTLAIPSFFSISYSISGFTWYANSKFIYDILSILQTMIHASILIVLCTLFILSVFLLCTSAQPDPKGICSYSDKT
jgi:hypothetical protein